MTGGGASDGVGCSGLCSGLGLDRRARLGTRPHLVDGSGLVATGEQKHAGHDSRGPPRSHEMSYGADAPSVTFAETILHGVVPSPSRASVQRSVKVTASSRLPDRTAAVSRSWT